MGGLIGSNAKQPSAVGSLQYQTSQQGGVQPLVYGTTRVAGNLLDYDDFTATPAKTSGSKGKGGGGGKGGGQQYMYSASFIIGFCQGPVAAFGTWWWDKNVGTPLSTSTFNLGADGQDADPFWVANHNYKALGYSGTANAVFAHYQMGNTATLPNFSLEIYGLESDSGVNGADCNPASMVYDFLTNLRYGAGFPLANLDPNMTSPAVGNSYLNYCFAAGIFLSGQLDTQQEAQALLGTISKLSNTAIVWSGALLKMIPYGDQPLTATYQIFRISGTITTPNGGDTVSLMFASPNIQGGTPVTATFTTTGMEQTYAAVAAGLAQAIIGTAALADAGVWASVGPGEIMLAFVAADVQTGVTVTAAYTGGVTLVAGVPFGPFDYTPNTLPIYSLGEDDWITQQTSVGAYLGVTAGGAALRQGASPITGGFTDDPVHIQRSTPADANNYIELECKDRGRSYNSHIIETFDQASVDLYGVRRDTSVKADLIVDPYLTGNVVASLMLQRDLLYRNTYTFTLGWKYILLEPMDLVQITDPRLGANAITVRITAVEEDDEGALAITAEDFFGAYSPTVLYPSPTFAPQPVPTILGTGGGTASLNANGGSGSGGYVPNWNGSPGNVNLPLIFEPPQSLSGSAAEIWIALSGSSLWGGSQVWISADGDTYAYAGTIAQPATQGSLTATMGNASSASPDVTDTCQVSVAESRGQLVSVSSTTAAVNATLCFAGGELFSYQTATLTGANAYMLSSLYRAAYGTTEATHPLGTQFAYVAQSVGQFPYLSGSQIGSIVYLKFPSANSLGGGAQTLAEVPAFTYTTTGALGASGFTPQSSPITGSVPGSPTANEPIWQHVIGSFGSTGTGITFPINLSGSSASATVAATAAATFTLKKHNTTIGTMHFAAGATTATFVLSTATLFQAGDILIIEAPSTPDATLANLSWSFAGTIA